MCQEVDELIERARAGDLSLLGQALERYRRYLTLLAQIEIGRQLQSKLDAADVVQETFLEAHRQFDRFLGTGEQFGRWLRQILAGTLAGQIRRYLGTQGRDVRLEQQLVQSIDQSSAALDEVLIASVSTPSQQATRREQDVLLADALTRLPEDYRDVIVLRHLEGLTFPEVARRMKRTVDSVEKLWLRALGKLRQTLGTKG